MTEPFNTDLDTGADFATALVELTVDRLDELRGNHAPRLELPPVFAGHRTNELTSADLAYVSGLLHVQGVDEVGGVGLVDVCHRVIDSLDADRVDDFAAYRVGETAIRLGGLDALPPQTAEQAVRAAFPTNTIPSVRAGKLPPNYAVVAARGLHNHALLTGEESGDLAEFVERSAELIGQRPSGWIDDGFGDHVHFDIYSPDMFLFSEPIAGRLGEVWIDGFRALLGDLGDVASRGGTVTWGRSIGALGLAIAVELAAAGSAHRAIDAPEVWLRRAVDAASELSTWFPNGIIAAHQRRATMFYRGPDRRLQMTLDIYGKLVLAAEALRRVGDTPVLPDGDQWPPVDRFIDIESPAGIWTHRSRHLSFVLPVIHGFSTDYLPTPRGHGLFEVPTSGPICFAPALHQAFETLTAAGMPTDVAHAEGRLSMRFDGWAPVGAAIEHGHARPGSRTVGYETSNRSLVCEESLIITEDSDASPVEAVSVTVPELADRPLDVELLSAPAGASVQAIDTSGIAEWRSFWHEIDRVHQITLPPSAAMSLRYRITAKLRVRSVIKGHPYDEGLYPTLRGRLVELGAWGLDEPYLSDLREIDVLHMHWPEWFTGVDPDWTAAVIDRIVASETPIVWTQHNLEPHMFKTHAARDCYGQWARAAAAVIHHSEHGKAVALDTYTYGDDTEHVVIHHGHWGDRYAPFESTTRADVEAVEGWKPCGLRLAVVGAPRAEKRLRDVVDAVSSSARDDIQLVIRADDDTVVPDDPRIIVDTEHIDDHRYLSRMRAFDALVLPFAAEGMMTTGTAFDAIGAGVAAITSDWGFFDETFDGGDIRYGWGAEALRDCIDSLSPDEIAQSSAAIRDLQPRFEWAAAADATFDLFERVCPR